MAFERPIGRELTVDQQVGAGQHEAVVITQDLLTYEIQGEDDAGRLKGMHQGTGIVRPKFWDRASYYGMERELSEALDELQG